MPATFRSWSPTSFVVLSTALVACQPQWESQVDNASSHDAGADSADGHVDVHTSASGDAGAGVLGHQTGTQSAADATIPSSPDASAPDCVVGEARCTKQQAVESCTPDGVWGVAAPCPFACTGAGECVGECKLDEMRCDPAHPLTTQSCVDGQWTSGTVCQNLCSNGSCAGSCTPRMRRCTATNVAQLCDDQGTWQPDTICPMVCTGAGVCGGECKPGAKDCSVDALSSLLGAAATPRLCGDDGMWAAAPACEQKTCSAGICIGSCSAGTTRCADNAAQVCDSSGQWTAGGPASCQIPNYALGAVVTSKTSTEYASWGRQNLVDGRTDDGFSTDVYHVDTPPADPCGDWVQLALTTNVMFSTVVLYPRTDATAAGEGFPVDYQVQVFDGTNWLTRADRKNQGPTTGPITHSWSPPDFANTLRVCATRLGAVGSGGDFYMQLSELEVRP